MIGPATCPSAREPGFSVFSRRVWPLNPVGVRFAAIRPDPLAVGLIGTALWRPTEHSIGYVVVGGMGVSPPSFRDGRAQNGQGNEVPASP